MPLTRPKHNQINTASAKFTDPLLELNSDISGNNLNDMGLIMRRGTSGDNAAVIWDRSTEEFALVTTTADGTATGDITISSYANLHVNQLKTAGLTYPTTDGTNGQVLTTNGAGVLSFTTPGSGISNVVEDTTPQLGGDLDLNSNIIFDAAAATITVQNNDFVIKPVAGSYFGPSEPDVLNAVAGNGSFTFSTGNSGVTGVITHLALETSGFTKFGIYSPDANSANLDFGTPGDTSGAGLTWTYGVAGATKTFKLGTKTTGGKLILAYDNYSDGLTIESDGTLNVASTTDYETLVTSDDDIPNKKYVDDTISSSTIDGGTF